MASEVVKTIPDDSGKRRVNIIRRTNGSFGFEEWYFSEHPLEKCWIPVREQMVTFTESAETAEREARSRIDWLIGEDEP